MKHRFFIYIAIFLVGISLIACNGEATEAKVTGKTEKTEQEIMVPVETLKLKLNPVSEVINYTGILKAKNSVDIIAEVSGKVENMNKKLGDRISKKDVLAVIDYRIPEANYKQSESQVLSAENNLYIAKVNFESDKELFTNGDISKVAFENSKLQVKNAEAQLLSAKAQLSINKKAFEDTHIQSPINGLISRENIEIGTMVTPGMAIYRVVDLSELKVQIGVSQSIVSRVEPGSKVEFQFSALNNKSFEGKVKYISPQADENTGSFTVEMEVKNSKDYVIKAGMTATVKLHLSDSYEKLLVPDYSFVERNGTAQLYKIENGRAKLTEVKTGKTFGQQVEIIDGLKAGDEIVIVGIENLGVNTKVLIENGKN